MPLKYILALGSLNFTALAHADGPVEGIDNVTEVEVPATQHATVIETPPHVARRKDYSKPTWHSVLRVKVCDGCSIVYRFQSDLPISFWRSIQRSKVGTGSLADESVDARCVLTSLKVSDDTAPQDEATIRSISFIVKSKVPFRGTKTFTCARWSDARIDVKIRSTKRTRNNST